MSCECQPPCDPDASFADVFFGEGSLLTTTPRLRFGDEWVEAYRDGDHVYCDHGGKTFQVVSRYGYWNSSICELLEASG